MSFQATPFKEIEIHGKGTCIANDKEEIVCYNVIDGDYLQLFKCSGDMLQMLVEHSLLLKSLLLTDAYKYVPEIVKNDFKSLYEAMDELSKRVLKK